MAYDDKGKYLNNEMWASSRNGCLLLQVLCYGEKSKINNNKNNKKAHTHMGLFSNMAASFRKQVLQI